MFTKQIYICHNKNEAPTTKDNIVQKQIFESQLQKYVNTEKVEVATLNAFPLFLYEYFK